MTKEVVNKCYMALGIAAGDCIYRYLFRSEEPFDFYKPVFMFIVAFLILNMLSFGLKLFKRLISSWVLFNLKQQLASTHCVINEQDGCGFVFGSVSLVGKAYNKLFKRDSQRVAFSLCVGLSD